MTPLLALALVVAAVWLVGGPQIAEAARAWSHRLPHLDRRHVAAAACVLAAALLWSSGRASPGPTPAPPAPDAALDLRGAWVSPDDAAKAHAMFSEIADELEWDAMQAKPLYQTGVSHDELRVRVFDLRLRGESLGARNPTARDRIKAYLDAQAGTAGGPLSPQQRSAWVAAYREVARSTEAVIR
jgi:hypothetical protein